jgi:transcriptional regulator with XRE-family HTH domain
MENWLNPQEVGKIIKAARRKAGLTQETLSGLAGINRTHLSAIENGKRLPTLEILFRLCSALKVNICDMIEEMKKYFTI